jgi:carboxypeptidase-like protein/TonB-dependent receptor-like protein
MNRPTRPVALRAIILCAAAWMLLLPRYGSAQTLSGRVTVLGDPFQAGGARVTVLDSLSQPVESFEVGEGGGFVIALPGPGSYSVAVSLSGYSTLLKDLGLVVTPGLRVELDLTPIGAGTVEVATEEQIRAMLERSVAASCGNSFDPEVNGVLTGMITDVGTAVPLPGIPVVIEWRPPGDTLAPTRSDAVLTNAEGVYLFCQAPGGQAVLLSIDAFSRGKTSSTVGIQSGAIHREDIALDFNDPAEPGMLFGSVIDREQVRPVSGAEVRIRDTDFFAITDENGFFRFESVPWGIYVLEVDHLGFARQEQPFRVHGSQAHKLEVQLSKEAIELEGLTVTVQSRRWFQDMGGMKRRMLAGFGHFISPEKLELRGVTRLSDALREIPGVRVRPMGTSGSVVLVRGKTCVPQVFVDGRLYRLDPYLGFNEPFGSDLYAIEVYTGPASVPGEFAYGSNTCGAVVVWTKRGR